MKKKLFRSFIVLAFLLAVAADSQAQRESFLGEIKLVGFNFAPRGWADCNGQLLPISNNMALFSLLGTIYGGDGRTTFALPDLRGRVPVGIGKADDTREVKQGEKSRPEKITASTDADGSAKTSTPYLGMRYVICTQGTFPSRN
ncbi:MAG: tail fiber protein [Chitinophagaceae bacterium]|nr:tail fiber protein [Chitinophagaceae bacterium]